jgi:hypothetical protein
MRNSAGQRNNGIFQVFMKIYLCVYIYIYVYVCIHVYEFIHIFVDMLIYNDTYVIPFKNTYIVLTQIYRIPDVPMKNSPNSRDATKLRVTGARVRNLLELDMPAEYTMDMEV